jgi:hypothetical protein
MYNIIHHSKGGPTMIASHMDLEEAVKIAKKHLGRIKEKLSEEHFVVTIWRAYACCAVVLDDGNGLSAYELKRIKE